MNKRVQRAENAACLGGISHPYNAKVNLYERFANDYLTVTFLVKSRVRVDNIIGLLCDKPFTEKYTFL